MTREKLDILEDPPNLKKGIKIIAARVGMNR